MTIPVPATSTPTLEQLRTRLCKQGFLELPSDLPGNLDDTLRNAAADATNLIILPLDNPAQRPEFFDLAVVLPEVLGQFAAGTFRVAFTCPPMSAAIVKRFGVLRHPALVFLRDGRYVGSIEGLRNWQDYLQSFAQLRDQAPQPAPISIPVMVAPSSSSSSSASGASR
jgi:hydrogenase-1 operon protein HyaE